MRHTNKTKAYVAPMSHAKPSLFEEPVRQITDPCRVCGGTRKRKKQGKAIDNSAHFYHPLTKPRLDSRRTYRDLELIVNPPKKYKKVLVGNGPFYLYVEDKG